MDFAHIKAEHLPEASNSNISTPEWQNSVENLLNNCDSLINESEYNITSEYGHNSMLRHIYMDEDTPQNHTNYYQSALPISRHHNGTMQAWNYSCDNVVDYSNYVMEMGHNRMVNYHKAMGNYHNTMKNYHNVMENYHYTMENYHNTVENYHYAVDNYHNNMGHLNNIMECHHNIVRYDDNLECDNNPEDSNTNEIDYSSEESDDNSEEYPDNTEEDHEDEKNDCNNVDYGNYTCASNGYFCGCAHSYVNEEPLDLSKSARYSDDVQELFGTLEVFINYEREMRYNNAIE